MVKIKELKKGDYFTLKDIQYPNSSQVYVRDDYCRSENKYFCHKFDDMSDYSLLKGDKLVFTDFIF